MKRLIPLMFLLACSAAPKDEVASADGGVVAIKQAVLNACPECAPGQGAIDLQFHLDNDQAGWDWEIQRQTGDYNLSSMVCKDLAVYVYNPSVASDWKILFVHGVASFGVVHYTSGDIGTQGMGLLRCDYGNGPYGQIPVRVYVQSGRQYNVYVTPRCNPAYMGNDFAPHAVVLNAGYWINVGVAVLADVVDMKGIAHSKSFWQAAQTDCGILDGNWGAGPNFYRCVHTCYSILGPCASQPRGVCPPPDGPLLTPYIEQDFYWN